MMDDYKRQCREDREASEDAFRFGLAVMATVVTFGILTALPFIVLALWDIESETLVNFLLRIALAGTIFAIFHMLFKRKT